MNKTSGPIKVTNQILNDTTGEISTNSEIVTRDKNFTKVWISNYINAVKEDYSKIDLIPFLLIEKMDKHNKIKSTLDNLAKNFTYPKTKLSLALKELRTKDFLRRIQNGLYMINPNIAYKGTSENRVIALQEYYGLKESKELIAEKERQKKIQETKSKLKTMSTEELKNLLTKNAINDSVLDLIAVTIVDSGDESNE